MAGPEFVRTSSNKFKKFRSTSELFVAYLPRVLPTNSEIHIYPIDLACREKRSNLLDLRKGLGGTSEFLKFS
jgi:hypothetical protein